MQLVSEVMDATYRWIYVWLPYKVIPRRRQRLYVYVCGLFVKYDASCLRKMSYVEIEELSMFGY